MKMMNYLFPKKLNTPIIELGSSIDNALKVLNQLGVEVQEENEKEHCFRVETESFDMAVYERNGKVKAVWYNDPLGRIWSRGKARKIHLYLQRYGAAQDWELRNDNGWMHYYFNDKAGYTMVYGVDNDVIRFNLQEIA